MGLTIHYRLKAPADTTFRDAKKLVEKLRERALELKFPRVGPVEMVANPPQLSLNDPGAASAWVDSVDCLQLPTGMAPVPALRCFLFYTRPGQGSESAAFGLAQYPGFITLADGTRQSTNLSGWQCPSRCKTQYAGNPRYGGFENFLRSHQLVVALIDAAIEMGLQAEVKDEGTYFEHRDVERLRQEVDKSNELIARMVGEMKDTLPGVPVAPITDYPNFEQLEARGRARNDGDEGVVYTNL